MPNPIGPRTTLGAVRTGPPRWRIGAALVAAATLLLGACTSDDSESTSGTTMPSLPPDAQAVVDLPPYDYGTWAYQAVDRSSGDVKWASDADQISFLGSTTKLFTVATYLDIFGVDQTLETPVYATAVPVGGTLTGDLVLVGAGDMIMGGRGVGAGDGDVQFNSPDHVYAYATPLATPVEGDPLAGLDDLAAQVVASGVTTVAGDVLVDERLWEPFETKEGVVTPIMVNDNLLDVRVDAGTAAGAPAATQVIPTTGYFQVVNEVTTTADGEADVTAELGADNRIVLTGSVPVGADPYNLAVFAPDPGAYTRALFIEALQRAGVTVTAPLTASAAALPPEGSYVEANQVASLTSGPASTFATLVLKISHNRGAETMLCLLAVEAGSKDCLDGLGPMYDSVEDAGVAPEQVLLYDGEGSDPSSATPQSVVDYLTWATTQPWSEVYEAALPDLDEDGTITAKSGTSAQGQFPPRPSLFVTQAEAGYMTTAGGERLIMAVYAKNATYPTVADGLQQSAANVKTFLRALRDAG
jgi:D-alanyl-D-alanine carboxypeptidase/D-alanyl-D-alanine-endopeptidase (penicillin-binding protein 4)